jgi:hypothetical protein
MSFMSYGDSTKRELKDDGSRSKPRDASLQYDKNDKTGLMSFMSYRGPPPNRMRVGTEDSEVGADQGSWAKSEMLRAQREGAKENIRWIR